MEENNKIETNTEGSGSGSMLYGTESQPQAQESGNSSVYGAGPQGTSPVQLTKPAEPVQLTKLTGTAPQPQVQNPYGPIQDPPPMQGAPEAKPKKNGAGVVVGILCAAAVVLVIAAGVLLARSLAGGNAQQQLAKGIANMAKEMAAYQGAVAGDIGIAELNQLKETGSIHTNIDLSITDPSASGSLSNVDVEVDAVTDYKEKMAEFGLSVGAYGFSVDVGSFAVADNTLYVSAPLLFEDVYSLNLTNLGRDFNNSAWSALMNETLPEDYSLTLFPDKNSSQNGEQSSGESVLQKLFLNHATTSEDGVQCEVLKQKRTFTIGGTSAEYGGVRVTMDHDSYNESMEAMRDAFLASDEYMDFMKGYIAAYAGDDGEFEEYWEEAVDTMFSLRFEQDFVLDFYLDKKGRIINISTPEDVAVSSEYVELESLAVDIGFAGTERTLDSIEGGVYVQSGDEILYMGISRTAALTEEYYSEDLTLCIQSDGGDDEITFRYTNDWGYADRSFDLEMTFEVPESSLGFCADGSFMEIVKGEGYTVRIAHSAVTIDGEDLLLLTGEIMTELAEDAIEVPDDATNLLEMSESDIMNLLYGYSSLY